MLGWREGTIASELASSCLPVSRAKSRRRRAPVVRSLLGMLYVCEDEEIRGLAMTVV